MIGPISSAEISDSPSKKPSVQYSISKGYAPSKSRLAPASSASPLSEGERIEVRGFLDRLRLQNPHPALSLEKGEATENAT